jgi:putative intracellular protease/amidase
MTILTQLILIAFTSFVSATMPCFAGAVQSLGQLDQRGLNGQQYNETLPRIPSPTEFSGKRIGFVVAPCFEEIELTLPLQFFALGGAEVHVIAPWWVSERQVNSCEYVRAKSFFTISFNFTAAQTLEWHALIVPGGQWSSAVVRSDGDAQKLIRQQYKNPNHLLATVCSGSTVLIDAKFSKSLKVTGSPANRVDLQNYGFDYQDVPVVRSASNLITGRSPQQQDNQLFTLAIADWLNTH